METEINQEEKKSCFYNHTGSDRYWRKLVWHFKIPA